MKETIVSLAYELRYDNAEGDLVEKVTETDPETVLLGHDFMLEVLEEKLRGLRAGDVFEMVIEPDEAYGDYDEDKVIELEEGELMAGVPEEERTEVEEGDFIPVEDEDGEVMQALVLKKENGCVTLDFNHPLAGETLHFKGKVLEVRPATEKEIADFMKENID